MRNSILRLIFASISVMLLAPAVMADEQTTRKQRNYIQSGNELYKQKRYAEAEVQYSKALEINPASEIALYNHSMSLLHQAQPSEPLTEESPLGSALKTLQTMIDAENATVGEFAAYNLGNFNFGKEQYQEAIECYKRALMRNPDNDQARENLRLAQLKLQQQEQNQDQNQDQQQDQNKEQQEQNQDKQDQNQDQNQNNNQNQDQQQQEQQPQQSGNISKENAQKILDTVEKAEAATRAKVEAEKKRDEQRHVRPKGPQW